MTPKRIAPAAKRSNPTMILRIPVLCPDNLFANVSGNQEGCDRNQDVRQVDQQVRRRRDQMQMPDGIGNDVGGIEETKKPEVDASRSRAHESTDESQCPQGEVSDIDKGGHREQTKHFAVCIHHPWHEIERIDREEEKGKREGELLYGAES
jgi:hypothetical protein